MAEVLSEPQFQVLTHCNTGEKTGRIYFPALFLAEFHECVTQWLQKQEVVFDETDVKQYADGSFRLYFRVNNPLEGEYLRLVNTFMEKSISENKEKSGCS
jgi:hypothetical protein